MKKFLVFLIFFVLLFLPFASALAQENFNHGEISVLQKDQVIDSDYFASGEKVVIDGRVDGDAYAVGGDITIAGQINGDLIVAGGNIEVSGAVEGDLRVAGGNITISGQIDKNLTVLGGSVIITNDARILGSVVGAVGNIDINAPVGKGITLAGGSLKISDSVGGDINVAIGEFSLESGSSVAGSIQYLSDKKLFKAQDALVGGSVIHNLPPETPERPKEKAPSAKFGFSVYGFLTLLATGLVFLYFFPNFMQRVSDQISKKAGVTFAVGLVALIVAPVLFLILLMSVIGVPFALLLVVGYIFLLIISQIFAAVFVGGWIGRRLKFKLNNYLSFCLGLFTIYLLGWIPVIGWIMKFIATTVGFGGYLITKKQVYSEFRERKVV